MTLVVTIFFFIKVFVHPILQTGYRPLKKTACAIILPLLGIREKKRVVIQWKVSLFISYNEHQVHGNCYIIWSYIIIWIGCICLFLVMIDMFISTNISYCCISLRCFCRECCERFVRHVSRESSQFSQYYKISHC